MRKTLHLDIPDSEWEPNMGLDDPCSGLIGPKLTINGSTERIFLHMEAWQVVNTEHGQTPADVWDEEYNLLHAAVGADGSFLSLRIGDRDYIVVITPHCD